MSKIMLKKFELKEGLNIIFLSHGPNQEFISNLGQVLSDRQEIVNFFNDKEVSVEFLVEDNHLPEIQVVRDILKRSQEVGTTNNLLTNNSILWLFKKENEIKVLTYRAKIEPEYDWLQVCIDFVNNYNNSEPDKGGYYKWGQIVPETCEYLCIDCGFIETFEALTVFPVCEVCLSGDPATDESYSGPQKGYWEKI